MGTRTNVETGGNTGNLTDLQIRDWIKRGERFEGKGDGDGLYLRFRKVDAVPSWIFRYRFEPRST